MKKLIYIFLIVATTAFIFSSCNKYEEGPAFSFQTKTQRITGDWELSKTYIDGTEQAADTTNIEMTIEKEGTGEIKIPFFGATISVNIEWEFDDTKENLRMRAQNWTTDSWGSWEESKILMLKSDEMWLEYTETDEVTGESYTQKDIWVTK